MGLLNDEQKKAAQTADRRGGFGGPGGPNSNASAAAELTHIDSGMPALTKWKGPPRPYFEAGLFRLRRSLDAYASIAIA